MQVEGYKVTCLVCGHEEFVPGRVLMHKRTGLMDREKVNAMACGECGDRHRRWEWTAMDVPGDVVQEFSTGSRVKGRTSVVLPKPMLEDLARVAARIGVSQSHVVARCIGVALPAILATVPDEDANAKVEAHHADTVAWAKRIVENPDIVAWAKRVIAEFGDDDPAGSEEEQ